MSYETLAREKAEALRRAGHARILAVESSCDETAMAVVEDGRVLKSSVIASQIDMHALYGGVVPEIASRMHVEALDPLLDQALAQADMTMDEIDAVAVTCGPGLVGALLTGVSWAKAFAYARDLPLIAVNHIEGHVSANYIASPDLEPPFVSTKPWAPPGTTPPAKPSIRWPGCWKFPIPAAPCWINWRRRATTRPTIFPT